MTTNDCLTEYYALTRDYRRFIKRAIALYENTRKEELEFERILDKDWNARTGRKIADIVKDLEKPAIITSNGSLDIVECGEKDGTCFIKFQQDPPVNTGEIFRGKIASLTGEKNDYGLDEIREYEYQLDVLKRLGNVRLISPWHNELRKALFFESQNVAWKETITDEMITHPTPTPQWPEILELVSSSESPRLNVLIGPASSGKTTILVEIIIQALLQDKRVLVSGYNHSTVNHILKVLYSRLDQLTEPLVDSFIIRLASEGTRKRVKEIAREHLLTNRLQRTLENCITGIKNIADPQTELGKIQQEWKTFARESLDIHFRRRRMPSPGEKKNEFDIWLLNCANVVFSTTMGLPSQLLSNLKGLNPFDLVILDDVKMLNIPRALIALELGKQWMIAGDLDQIGPFIDFNLERALKTGQETLIGGGGFIYAVKVNKLLSLPLDNFKVLQPEESVNILPKIGSDTLDGRVRTVLTTKYRESILEALPPGGTYSKHAPFELYYNHRMNKALADVIYPSLYGKDIETDQLVVERDQKIPMKVQADKYFLRTPVTILDTSLTDTSTGSRDNRHDINKTEAEMCVQVLVNLLNYLSRLNYEQIKDILLITRFQNQKEEIIDRLSDVPQLVRTEDYDIFEYQDKKIRVQTIAMSSNDEGDTVIFSLTADFKRNLSFLNDYGAITVGFTRVKSFLVIVGQYDSMMKAVTRSWLKKIQQERVNAMLTGLRTLASEKGHYQIVHGGGDSR